MLIISSRRMHRTGLSWPCSEFFNISCYPGFQVSHQDEVYRDLQSGRSAGSWSNIHKETAALNLLVSSKGQPKELTEGYWPKGWRNANQGYLETRSSTTSADTTGPVPDQHGIFDEDTISRYLVIYHRRWPGWYVLIVRRNSHASHHPCSHSL